MSRNDETRPIGDVKFISGGGGFYPARRCDGPCGKDVTAQIGSSRPMRGHIRQWWCPTCTAAKRAARAQR